MLSLHFLVMFSVFFFMVLSGGIVVLSGFIVSLVVFMVLLLVGLVVLMGDLLVGLVVLVMFLLVLLVVCVLLSVVLLVVNSLLLRLLLVSNRFLVMGWLRQVVLSILVGVFGMVMLITVAGVVLDVVLFGMGRFMMSGLLVVVARLFMMVGMGSFLVLLVVDFFVVLLNNLLRLLLDHLHGLLLVMNDVFNGLSLHGLGERGALMELLGLLQNSLVLSLDRVCVLFLKIHADLVVDERKDHAVVDRDEVGGLVFGVLASRLHEHKSAVG